ncbi:hypothetical protein IMZ48_27605 [Candidatus Bathyarchaeota archaeon]|nr:hypothetical protein [Candidatus Bathyarchaeota archaeon]
MPFTAPPPPAADPHLAPGPMTPAQPAKTPDHSSGAGHDERSFADTPTLQTTPQKPAPQGPDTDNDGSEPAAGEWADAVLSSALGTISNDGPSSLR